MFFAVWAQTINSPIVRGLCFVDKIEGEKRLRN